MIGVHKPAKIERKSCQIAATSKKTLSFKVVMYLAHRTQPEQGVASVAFSNARQFRLE